jgi:hypothetical protein
MSSRALPWVLAGGAAAIAAFFAIRRLRHESTSSPRVESTVVCRRRPGSVEI